MTTQTIDEQRAGAFAERLVGVLNDAFLALLVSLGHRVGLFETLSGLGPSTSERIAAEAGLEERYVREWLGGMTVGGIVEYDPAGATYVLPAEHTPFLIPGPDNLASTMQFVGLLGSVETEVAEVFRSGGGVSYEAFHRFHELMAEDSANVHDAALVDVILPLVPGLVDRLREGLDVCDVGCGRGHAINLMAQAFPASRFVGVDISAEAIEAALAEARELGLTNATFEVRDAATLEGAYDLVTAFDAIHDQAAPDVVLDRVAAALRPQGTFLMVDVHASSELHENLDLPLGPMVYAISTMHCTTVSLAQGGAGLGATWGEQTARRMLSDAGFSDVRVESIEGDVFNSYYIATK